VQAGFRRICDPVASFAKEVMPSFRVDPEPDAWKAGVVSGAIQLEQIDTEAFSLRRSFPLGPEPVASALDRYRACSVNFVRVRG
jgi:hypothetical protein